MDMHFDGVIFHTYADELARRVRYSYPPFAILDVRPAADHEAARIPGSVRIDPANVTSLPDGATPTTEIFVVGSGPEDSGVRQAALALKGLGALRVVELRGGLWEWERRGLPLEGSRARAA